LQQRVCYLNSADLAVMRQRVETPKGELVHIFILMRKSSAVGSKAAFALSMVHFNNAALN
jgi:hypothetical protein